MQGRKGPRKDDADRRGVLTLIRRFAGGQASDGWRRIGAAMALTALLTGKVAPPFIECGSK